MPFHSSARSVVIGLSLGLVVRFAFAAPPAGRSRQPGLPRGPLPIAAGTPRDFTGLANVIRLSEKLYSGGVPEGDAGFTALRRLGIRTVISVDGMTPDVARARRLGMRSVHLPFGYDGCPRPTAVRIVRAVRDLPGPIYLHCHHGKNRAPTAAAFARVSLDGVPTAQAVREMAAAGTGKEYVGLYDAVRGFQAPSAAELDRVPVPLREVSPTPPWMAAMVEGERRYARLVRFQQANWPARSRRAAAHEALQLREWFAELQRRPDAPHGSPAAPATHTTAGIGGPPGPPATPAKDAPSRGAGFRRLLSAGEAEARRLEQHLRKLDRPAAGRSLNRIGANCAACHSAYRNVPSPELSTPASPGL